MVSIIHIGGDRMKYLIVVLILLITGCSESPVSILMDYSIQGSDKAAEFILTCTKNANPMSDEEGEDLVHGCEQTAKRLYGKPVYYVFRNYARVCLSPTRKETLVCYNTLYGEE